MNDQHDPTAPGEIARQLNAAAIGLDGAADRLRDLTRTFEGGVDDAGEYQPGPQLLGQDLVNDELDDLVREYESAEKRPPVKEVMQHRATRRAKAKNPDLWADYHRLQSEIAAIQKWIAAKEKTISARQSVLRSEGLLSGHAPAQDGVPAWANRGRRAA